jgi:hypothetical protein
LIDKSILEKLTQESLAGESMPAEKELDNKDRLKESYEETMKNMEKFRAIKSDDENSSGDGLITVKVHDDIFRSSASSQDTKKTTSSYGSLFGSSTSSTKSAEPEKKSYGYYGYGSSVKKEESKEEKANAYIEGLLKKSAKRVRKDKQKEEHYQNNMWNIFELKEREEQKKKEYASLEDKAKARVKDQFRKTALKGIIAFGQGILKYVYTK